MREKPRELKEQVLQYIAMNGLSAAKIEFKGQIDYTTMIRWVNPKYIKKAKERYLKLKQRPEFIKLQRFRDKQWRETKGKQYISIYNKLHKEKLNTYQREWNERNKEKKRQYERKWLIKNKDKVNARCRDRYKNNPMHKLMHINRIYLDQLIKRTKYLKIGSCKEYLGADPTLVKEYIKKQFQPGMTWDNHGKWHIDHIIPLSSAKNEQELKQLFHYTNLQPLWKLDNLKKGDKL
jgi:hypothetical protein